ncbi:MAG: T9SS type A sorting domain-containing protein [Bacteroidetes bacterium]|nr:T9SS type A sorting domain-containing protein [Bacteroidota bacterium]
MQNSKKILIALLFFFTMYGAKSQVVLEHTYVTPNTHDLGLLNIGNELKYVVKEYDSSYFNLYNLDHSLYRHVVSPIKFDRTVDSLDFTIVHISNSIIDCDSSTVEFIVMGGKPRQTRIYNEKGNLIFSIDSFIGYNGFAPFGQPQTFIERTPNGTTMNLVNSLGLKNITKVYHFCGKYTGMKSPPLRHNDPDDGGTYNNYPNPTTNETRIDYTLPAGVSNATIVLFNAEGKEVNRYRVDNTFDNLIINTQNLAAGVYNYSLISKGRTEPGGRIVVVK